MEPTDLEKAIIHDAIVKDPFRLLVTQEEADELILMNSMLCEEDIWERVRSIAGFNMFVHDKPNGNELEFANQSSWLNLLLRMNEALYTGGNSGPITIPYARHLFFRAWWMDKHKFHPASTVVYDGAKAKVEPPEPGKELVSIPPGYFTTWWDYLKSRPMRPKAEVIPKYQLD